MCDCLWFCIGVCDEQCRCNKYLSLNSDEGQAMGDKWQTKINEVLAPLRLQFAEENGFDKGDTDE